MIAEEADEILLLIRGIVQDMVFSKCMTSVGLIILGHGLICAILYVVVCLSKHNYITTTLPAVMVTV